MNYLKLFVSLIFVLTVVSCSTMRTTRQAAGISEITANKTYQLRVRSGNIALDKILHDYASMKFGEYLRITGKGPFNGYVEIVFSNASINSLSGPTASYTRNMIYGNLWYTGDDSPWSDSYNQAPGTGIATGGKLSWQNSSTVLLITDNEGTELWKSYYNYRGGSEFSGLIVKTADEAARLSIDKIMEQFEKEFILIPQTIQYEEENKMPETTPVAGDNAAGSQKHSGSEETVPVPAYGTESSSF